jgi:phosphoribosylaminoimidazolecarboxamide formyltransferase/IMP cyclohydrolase
MVLVSGGGTNLQALLEAEQTGRLGPARLAVVVSDRPGAYALERAKRWGIPVYVEEPNKRLGKDERRRELSDRLFTIARDHHVRLIVLAGFLSILAGRVIRHYSGRIINLHPSLLPKYGGEGMYGERVHRAVLDSGDKESGCTVHLVDAGTDTGPILLQRKVPVMRGDTPDALADRIHEQEHIAIVEAAAMMAERLRRELVNKQAELKRLLHAEQGKPQRSFKETKKKQISAKKKRVTEKKMKEPIVNRRRALISVFNKDGILELASFLTESKKGGASEEDVPGWEILSTGGTSKYLQEHKIPVTDVAAVTGFPECLDGRVKTLHPEIHAGLLARRNEQSHMDTLQKLNLSTIDLVCVNLYPFFEKVQAGLSLEETVEFIDIGGPTMLRSAAKNYRDVIVLTDPDDYAETIAGLTAGEVSQGFRKRLAGKVFDLTSAYDAAIARYLLDEEYPHYWPLSLKKGQSLRYGENGHQSAALYLHTDRPGVLGSMEQLHGKELGFNNIRDLDLAWKAACAFGLPAAETAPIGGDEVRQFLPAAAGGNRVCCVAVKHNTPCGIALGDTLLEAYEKTYACDPVSIFGGIVACTTTVDAATAAKLGELFLEIVAAPDFAPDALEILKKKKNLRILKLAKAPQENYEYTAVDGGLLVQQSDRRLLEKWEVVTKVQPAEQDIRDLIFGMRAVTFVKSNAIMIVKDEAAAGIGGGQVNRIWPAVQSLERSAEAIKTAAEHGVWKDGKGARVLASDAFFPFADVVEAAAAAGIKSIIQPGGSLNDKLSIEACDKHGIAMVFTGLRHFKH